MKPKREVGIVGYGAYVPRYRIKASEIARVWGGADDGLPIEEKAVPGLDEDTITMSVEAARNALARAQIDPRTLRAVWVGSESHPYAVKPSSTLVAEALGASGAILAGDWQFACKAGTEAMQAAIALVGSEMTDYALAIGMDTAQGRPHDALEYTAGAGGGAYIMGPAENALAVLEGSYSYVTDTPDFFRRAYQHYPEHGNRFTGEPAYFAHTLAATQNFLELMQLTPRDFQWAIFHQPNAKFPLQAAAQLGFTRDQVAPGLLVNKIGNTYAGAALIGMTNVLDNAKPGDRILLVSFGSGAGSDAFSYVVTDKILERRDLAKRTAWYTARRELIDYARYARFRNKLVMN
ncbi:MAG: 3-oxoacyl-[acyl-carrier-protein] synthase 3 [Anaerolineae bacterium]|nr:3-oxoacyl-[acyl-carrier-protein] synthase 3 [Anaerolineae bacterium]